MRLKLDWGKAYECRICAANSEQNKEPYVFQKQTALNTHVNKSHSKKICLICGEYVRYRKFRTHIAACRRKTDEPAAAMSR
jgi:hypothetical protein